MHRHHTPRALQRSKWFKELTATLTEAEKLLSMLEADGGFPVETVRLRLRVQAARSELELLNRVALGEERVVGKGWPGPPPRGDKR